jgi:hypothetical protein
VPKKESKERFSSMITITWQILWTPRGAAHRACRRDAEPQPAVTQAARTTTAKPEASFS